MIRRIANLLHRRCSDMYSDIDLGQGGLYGLFAILIVVMVGIFVIDANDDTPDRDVYGVVVGIEDTGYFTTVGTKPPITTYHRQWDVTVNTTVNGTYASYTEFIDCVEDYEVFEFTVSESYSNFIVKIDHGDYIGVNCTYSMGEYKFRELIVIDRR